MNRPVYNNVAKPVRRTRAEENLYNEPEIISNSRDEETIPDDDDG